VTLFRPYRADLPRPRARGATLRKFLSFRCGDKQASGDTRLRENKFDENKRSTEIVFRRHSRRDFPYRESEIAAYRRVSIPFNDKCSDEHGGFMFALLCGNNESNECSLEILGAREKRFGTTETSGDN